MKAHDFVANQAWAMRPEALAGVFALVDRAEFTPEMIEALHGKAAVSTMAGKPLDNARSVEVRDGVACIPVRGVITRYATLFSEISGATSIEALAKDFRAALDDPSVKAILLDVDSPGGMVSGTGEFADIVHTSRSRKPVVAYVGDQADSAAYWIASSASRIVLAPTAEVGSIGVVARKPRNSDEIVSTQSPMKRPNAETESGRAEIQRSIDATAQVFIDAVARNRGVSAEDVVEKFGRGGVKVGKAAVDAGMADEVGYFEATLASLARGDESAPKSGTKNAAADAAQPKGSPKMLVSLKSLFGLAAKHVPDAAAVEVDDAGEVAPVATGELKVATAEDVEAKVAEAVKAALAKADAEKAAQALDAVKALAATEADTFLAGLVKAEKVKPHEVPGLKAAFVAMAASDHANPATATVNGKVETYSLVKSFKAELGNRPTAKLTEEQIPTDAASVPADKLKDLHTLPVAAATAPADAAKAAEDEKVINAMLAATPEGREHLASKQAAR